LHSRNSFGIETTNTTEFVSYGTVVDDAGLVERNAELWGRFNGGGHEVLVPSPGKQIQIDAVTMPDSPLPWWRPTDPIIHQPLR